jgi:hypothetical protein
MASSIDSKKQFLVVARLHIGGWRAAGAAAGPAWPWNLLIGIKKALSFDSENNRLST